MGGIGRVGLLKVSSGELAEDFLGDSEAALSRLLTDKSYKRFSREKSHRKTD